MGHSLSPATLLNEKRLCLSILSFSGQNLKSSGRKNSSVGADWLDTECWWWMLCLLLCLINPPLTWCCGYQPRLSEHSHFHLFLILERCFKGRNHVLISAVFTCSAGEGIIPNDWRACFKTLEQIALQWNTMQTLIWAQSNVRPLDLQIHSTYCDVFTVIALSLWLWDCRAGFLQFSLEDSSNYLFNSFDTFILRFFSYFSQHFDSFHIHIGENCAS